MNVAISTQNNFHITGIAFPRDFSILADTVDITTGTPFSIGGHHTPDSYTVGAIVAGGIPLHGLTLFTDTHLPKFQYTLIPPSPTTPPSIPPTPPNPIVVNPAKTWETAIAQTLQTNVSITEVETLEGESAIAISWEDVMLWLPSLTEVATTPTVTLLANAEVTTTEAIAQIEQTENNFTQAYLQAYPELEEREPIRYETIRDSLEQIHAQTGQEAAILYAWWDVEGLRLGVVRRDRSPVVQVVRVDREKVEAEVQQLFNALKNQQPINNETLSNWLINPIFQDIEGVDTILFSLDDGLRSIPIAALAYNEKYLIQKYTVASIPSVALTKLSQIDLNNAEVLAMGSTKTARGQSEPLQFVDNELSAIAQYREGEFYLDAKFTSDKIDNNTAPILHLAAHGTQDFLMLYQKNLKIEEFAKLTSRGDKQAEKRVENGTWQTSPKRIELS
ncbi:MAG: CHAT domain-containing protein, partial [Cyanobacteria bacterium P01_E01_bin.42]